MKEFEKILKIFMRDYNLKIYYIDAGFNLYLIKFLGKYQIYYDYDESLDLNDNVNRCAYYIRITEDIKKKN